jgi:hypothetical protein
MSEDSIVAILVAILGGGIAIWLWFLQSRKENQNNRKETLKRIIDDIEKFVISPLPKATDENFVEKGNRHFSSINTTFDGLYILLIKEKNVFLKNEYKKLEDLYSQNTIEQSIKMIEAQQDDSIVKQMKLESYQNRVEFINEFTKIVLKKYHDL